MAKPKSLTSRDNLKLNIMNWYLKVLRKYADFGGRARRKEYWMFVLFNLIFAVVAAILDSMLGSSMLIYGLYGLAMLIPSLAVTVRRLHDIGKSGWMFLIILIPIIGFIWLLILLIKDGDHAENQYGADPKS